MYLCQPAGVRAMAVLKKKYYFFLDFFLSGACESADAATDFTVSEDLGFFNNLDALLATDFEVFSLLAIIKIFKD